MIKNLSKMAACLLVTLIFLNACTSNPTSNDPNEVLSEFIAHLAKKDIAGASRFVTSGSKLTLQIMKSGLAMAENSGNDLASRDWTKELETVVIEPARISGDSAFIVVKSDKTSGYNVEFNLLKEDDGWKVNFTTGALLQMGMKTAGQNNADSLLPDINIEELQNGMKLADSMLKNASPELLNDIKNRLKNLQ